MAAVIRRSSSVSADRRRHALIVAGVCGSSPPSADRDVAARVPRVAPTRPPQATMTFMPRATARNGAETKPIHAAKRRPRLQRLGVVLLAVIVLGAAGFYGWTRVARYAAIPEAAAVAARAERDHGWYVFAPEAAPVAGFVFYPGGLIDPAAYAPLMQRLADDGVLAVIVPMPLDLAVLGIGRAAAVIAAYPQVGTWAIGGHSLGGAMAAQFVLRDPESVDGLALLAGYPAASTDLSAWPGQAVSLFGSADGVASRADVESGLARLPPGTRLVVIDGGNHAQFGLYGPQAGDGEAAIDREEQQRRTSEALLEFLRRLP